MSIDIALDYLSEHFSVKGVLFIITVIFFLMWCSADILPALEHITLSMRTSDHGTIPADVNKRLSNTLVPFGRFCSKLFIAALGFMLISWITEKSQWLSVEWDANIKALKQKKKRKVKKLESDIDQIQFLSEKTAIISAAAKDIEVLADKLERLKLVMGTLEKPKPLPPSTQDKQTKELFAPIASKHPSPPRQAKRQRPEF